ncbi:unnamed protein product [Prunus armeniaca]
MDIIFARASYAHHLPAAAFATPTPHHLGNVLTVSNVCPRHVSAVSYWSVRVSNTPTFEDTFVSWKRGGL